MTTSIAIKTGRVAAGGSLLLGGVAGALVLAPQANAATTYTVTNTADSGAGSLRQAIDDANNNAGADIIVFGEGSTGTITLTTGNLIIADDITITGLGAADSIISGNNASRIFYIYNDAKALTVSISGLTLTHGSAQGYTLNGGAIANWGNDLTLSGVVLSGNSAAGAGGAINSEKSFSEFTNASASLTIIDSEISDNNADESGGGLAAHDVGNVTITNTVVSGNTAGGGGGGVFLKRVADVSIDSTTFDQNVAGKDGGGLYATITGSFTMTNSTVSGNSALDGAGIELGANGAVLIANSTIANNSGSLYGGQGGALYSWGVEAPMRIIFTTISGNTTRDSTVKLSLYDGGLVDFTGTVISDNTTSTGTGTQANDLDSNSLTISSSLVMGTVSAFTDGGGNVFGVSAQLGALADNGGATFTMEPASGSPVIDAGPLTWTAFTGDGSDQRGGLFLRVYNGQSEMGALEVQPEPVPPTTTTTVGPDPVMPRFTG